ncbi:hypothetical protein FIV37_17660 [Pseudomonas gessardii]|nr:hypothetical protein [Pseudomonas gessardii]
MLRVVAPPVTLCVTLWTRSVQGCIPTQSVGTILRSYVRTSAGLRLIAPTLRVVAPPVTLCVTLWTRGVLGCIPTQSVGTILCTNQHRSKTDRSHAPRGSASCDALRHAVDAERPGLHSHAERGNDLISGCVTPAPGVSAQLCGAGLSVS